MHRKERPRAFPVFCQSLGGLCCCVTASEEWSGSQRLPCMASERSTPQPREQSVLRKAFSLCKLVTSTFKHPALRAQRSDGAKERTWVSFRRTTNELGGESVTTGGQGRESAAVQYLRHQSERPSRHRLLTTLGLRGNASVVQKHFGTQGLPG